MSFISCQNFPKSEKPWRKLYKKLEFSWFCSQTVISSQHLFNRISTAQYSHLTFIHPDWSCSCRPANEMIQGNEKLLMGMFLQGNICQRKNELEEKNITRSQKAALSTYRVTHLSWSPKNPKCSIGKKFKISRVDPPNLYENLKYANFYKFCSHHKLRVLSDSKTWTFAPNSEFLSKTVQIYSKIRST